MSRLHPFAVLLLPLVACVTTSSDGKVVETSGDAATLLARADGQFDSRAYDTAFENYKLAAYAANGEGDVGLEVQAASQVAHVRALTGHLEDGRIWLAQATERVEREDSAAWCRWLIARGVYERADGMTERAMATFEEAYDEARATGQARRALQAAHWSTVTAPDQRAVRWCGRAIEVARTLDHPGLVAELWFQLGWLLEERGLHEDALAAFRRARSETPADDEHGILVADWCVGHSLRRGGQLAAARTLMTDVAERASRGYSARRLPNDAEWLGHVQAELAELDFADGEVELAVTRMEVAIERLLEAGARNLAAERLASHEERLVQMRSALEVELTEGPPSDSSGGTR